VRDSAPTATPIVSAWVRKDTVGRNSTDAVDGNSTFGPYVDAIKGNGYYYVTIAKTAAGAEAYTLDYQCETRTGVGTGTRIVRQQNQ
jgi:hypothetical protein